MDRWRPVERLFVTEVALGKSNLKIAAGVQGGSNTRAPAYLGPATGSLGEVRQGYRGRAAGRKCAFDDPAMTTERLYKRLWNRVDDGG